MTIAPTFPRGTLSVGELFSATMATYRARFGLFLLLGAVPAAAWLAAMAGVTAFALSELERQQAAAGTPLGEDLAVLGVVFLVMFGSMAATAVMMMVQLWTHALMSLATRALAAGHRPVLAEMLARNKGFTGRAGVLIGAIVGIGLVTGALTWLPTLVPDVAYEAYSLLGGPAASVLFFLEVALVVVMLRLVYVVPVMAIERESGMAAIRRAWELTRGVFLPTLGALAVCALFVGAVGGIASALGFGVMLLTAMDEGVFVTPASWAVFLIGQTILLALLTPVGSIYVAGMYVNRLRQLNGEPPSAYLRYPAGARWPGRPDPGPASSPPGPRPGQGTPPA